MATQYILLEEFPTIGHFLDVRPNYRDLLPFPVKTSSRILTEGGYGHFRC